MKRKLCRKCGRKRLVKFFAKNGGKKDGLSWQCKDCQSAYHRQHYLGNKHRYIANAKEYRQKLLEWVRGFKKECTVCGEDHVACLAFHHRDPSKKEMSITAMVARVGVSRAKIVAETKKCDVMCHNCHAKLHWNDKQE